MFGLFRTSPQKLARIAMPQVLDGEPTALADIRRRSRKDQVAALAWLGRLLMLDDAYALARPILDEAQQLAPKDDDIAGLLAECRDALGDSGAVDAHLRAQLEREPRNIDIRFALIDGLITHGDLDGARALLDAAPVPSLRLETLRAKVLAESGDSDAACTLLDAILERQTTAMRGALDEANFYAARNGWNHANDLKGHILAETYGAEAVIIDAAQRGDIIADHPHNLTLLGQALMARTETSADPTLLSPTDRIAQGTPVGIAEAHLRDGRVEPARTALAPLADARDFAGFLGMGWARRLPEIWRFVRFLPEPAAAETWTPLFPDYAALNREERRIVAASVEPLRALCAPMVAADVRVHILPLDARPSDLPDWSDSSHRTGDNRASDAVGGMARHTGAVVRLDELWRVGPKGNWTLGHEFAHLALFHMADVDFDRVAEIYARCMGVDYIGSDYQRSNVDEFFAMGYQDWLTRQHGGEGHALSDDHGVVEALDALFNEFAARA